MDAARLARLLDEYLDAASGRRPVHRLPLYSDEDAAQIVDRVHAEMDTGEQARASFAREVGHEIACARGCNFCCANVIVVYEPEAERVARWLADPAHAEARSWFEEAYPRWKAEVGDGPDRLQRLHEQGETERAQAVYDELQRRHPMCAFNRAGSCTIHPVRPDVCRHAHALDTADRCRPGSAERPQAIEFPPLDGFVQRALSLFRTMHRRRRGQEGPAALCDAVSRRLPAAAAAGAAPPASRNRPCPCGSGRKYKHCCGAQDR